MQGVCEGTLLGFQAIKKLISDGKKIMSINLIITFWSSSARTISYLRMIEAMIIWSSKNAKLRPTQALKVGYHYQTQLRGLNDVTCLGPVEKGLKVFWISA
jgi:hypothetical protein